MMDKKTGISDSLEDNRDTWKVLIVDDEEEIHRLTRIVLDEFTFEDKRLIFLSAYSGAEAVEVVKNNPDIALILLDVVMETDDAGLKVVQTIREELKNIFVQIVLRTGQAGQADSRQHPVICQCLQHTCLRDLDPR